MGRLLIRLGGLAAAMLLVGPAGAFADVRFEGRTSQGRPVAVVAGDDGTPKRARIRWRSVCRSGLRGITTTGFRRPLDLSTRRRFRDSGTYSVREPTGARATITATISGRKAGPRRWVGRFRAVTVVRRGGRVRDRCSVRGLRWRALRG
jgi:hypothetical protein